MRRAVLFVTLLALVVAGALPGVAGEERLCKDVGAGTDSAPKVGRVFQSGVKADFDDSSHDHVPDGWSSSSNYSSSECDRRMVANDNAENDTDVFEQQIMPDATPNARSGDVSIFRSYRARRWHKYRVTARVALRNPSGDFRGRLKVSAWKDSKQLEEQFRDLCSSGSDGSAGRCASDASGFVEIQFETRRFPAGTNIIKIAWRARATRDKSADGVAILDWIKYVRIK